MTTTNAASALSGDTATPAAATVDTTIVDSGAAAISDAASTTVTAADPVASDAWFSKLENPEVRTWAEAKGWKDPLSAAESAYNLEKLVGFDKAGRTIVVPDENSTPEQVAAFRSKLGVPETAEGYKLPVPDGMDAGLATEAAKWFHEQGVPPKAAEGIVARWNETMAAQQQAADKAFEVQSNSEYESWATEQGAALKQNQELAKRAAQQFIPAKDATERQSIMSAMERAMGTDKFMRMMASIGSGLGEGRMLAGGENTGILTPAQAGQRVAELKSNKEWSAAYLSGDKTKLTEMENLLKLAYPSTQE